MEQLDEALGYLTETLWDGPLDGCLEPRDQLYYLLDLSTPEERTGLVRQEGEADKAADEFASYGALVNETGY